jgi:hypothetical protein
MISNEWDTITDAASSSRIVSMLLRWSGMGAAASWGGGASGARTPGASGRSDD